MMTYHTLGHWVTAEPFRPFRIRMASGQTYEIRHPEMIAVKRTSARISYFASETKPDGERESELSLMLMEAVEPLDVPAQSRSQ
jgi:hypothetical protein